MQRKIDLALIGYEPKGSENLTIRLLAASVINDGFKAAVVPALSLTDAHRCIRDAISLRPSVIGLSLQDSQNAVHTLALAGLARRLGFGGFIVCGGPFATLNTDWVLSHSSAVDGVIRHAGERPLRELLGGTCVEQICGMATRTFQNPPEFLSQSNWRPLRGRRPSVLSIATADILTGRGCQDRCEYCTHSALASLKTREYSKSGASPEQLRASDLDHLAVRPLDDLADEMSELYHDHGVRFFQMIDENPIPKRESTALDWIASFKQSLRRRNVNKIALGLMLRGDALTNNIIDALVDLGMVRTLVGIESAQDLSLESLGRKGNAASGIRTLARLEHHGVVTLFNSLLIHPQSNAKTIQSELDFLSTVQGSLFETVRALPLAGTVLNKKMAQNGTLTGGTILSSYQLPDPVASRFANSHKHLHSQAMGPYSPTLRAVDTLLSAVLLNRFKPGKNSRQVERQLRQLTMEINTSRTDTLKALLTSATNDTPIETAVKRASNQWFHQHALLATLENKLITDSNGDLSCGYKNYAAAATIVFALAVAPGCKSLSDSPDTEETVKNTDADTDTCEQRQKVESVDRLRDLLLANCNNEARAIVTITLDSNGRVKSVEVDNDTQGEMAACYEELLKNELFPCLEEETLVFFELSAGPPVF